MSEKRPADFFNSIGLAAGSHQGFSANPFTIAGSAYLLALLVIQLLIPRIEPVDFAASDGGRGPIVQ